WSNPTQVDWSWTIPSPSRSYIPSCMSERRAMYDFVPSASATSEIGMCDRYLPFQSRYSRRTTGTHTFSTSSPSPARSSARAVFAMTLITAPAGSSSRARSNTLVSTPAFVSAVAAASPARPPPMTMTRCSATRVAPGSGRGDGTGRRPGGGAARPQQLETLAQSRRSRLGLGDRQTRPIEDAVGLPTARAEADRIRVDPRVGIDRLTVQAPDGLREIEHRGALEHVQRPDDRRLQCRRVQRRRGLVVRGGEDGVVQTADARLDRPDQSRFHVAPLELAPFVDEARDPRDQAQDT